MTVLPFLERKSLPSYKEKVHETREAMSEAGRVVNQVPQPEDPPYHQLSVLSPGLLWITQLLLLSPDLLWITKSLLSSSLLPLLTLCFLMVYSTLLSLHFTQLTPPFCVSGSNTSTFPIG